MGNLFVFCVCCLRRCFTLSAELWGAGGKGLDPPWREGAKPLCRTSVLCEEGGEREGRAPLPQGQTELGGKNKNMAWPHSGTGHRLLEADCCCCGVHRTLRCAVPKSPTPERDSSTGHLLCSDDNNGPPLPPGSVCPWQVWKGNVLSWHQFL